MVYAGILAGGMGERVGGLTPKQFLEVSGKPIIYWPLQKFYNNESIEKIVVSTRKSHIGFVHSMIGRYFSDVDKFIVIEGGSTRFHSMENIALHLKNELGVNDGAMLIHEAARPLISQRVINDHIAALVDYGATNTLFPAIDTMMISEDGEFITSIPDKSKMYIGQTPQGYDFRKFIDILENKVTKDDILREVDFCSIFLSQGNKVKIVKGDENLFKVTHEKDLVLFENALLNITPTTSV